MANGQLEQTLKSFKLNEKFISQVLGVLVIVVVGVLIYNYFSGFEGEIGDAEMTLEETSEVVELIEEDGKIVPSGLPREYEIQAGEDLWKIAEKHYQSGYNWVDIAEANSLANPNLIEAGQKLMLPKVEVKEATVALMSPEKAIKETSYEIQEGDYLWDVALRAYGDGYRWIEIAEANNLTDPNIIHPGNRLNIPR